MQLCLMSRNHSILYVLVVMALLSNLIIYPAFYCQLYVQIIVVEVPLGYMM